MTEYQNPKGKNLDANGYEILSSTPMSPPVGFVQQPSMMEMVRNMIRSEKLRQEAAAAGAESFEEADDFDVGDDFDPHSPYEVEFDPPVPLSAPEPTPVTAATDLVAPPPQGADRPIAGAAPEAPTAPPASPSAPPPAQ